MHTSVVFPGLRFLTYTEHEITVRHLIFSDVGLYKSQFYLTNVREI